MKSALIIGASGGIGAAIVRHMDKLSWSVTQLSRQGGDFDLFDPGTLDHRLAGLDAQFDLIVMATGQLASWGQKPEKTVRRLEPAVMQDAFLINAVGPAILCKHADRLLPKDRPSGMGILSARVGSIEDNRLGGWISYRTSKAALNQIVRTTAIELQFRRPKAFCVALHPGTVQTEFTKSFHGTRPMKTAAEAAENLVNVLNNLEPQQSGQFFNADGIQIPW